MRYLPTLLMVGIIQTSCDQSLTSREPPKMTPDDVGATSSDDGKKSAEQENFKEEASTRSAVTAGSGILEGSLTFSDRDLASGRIKGLLSFSVNLMDMQGAGVGSFRVYWGNAQGRKATSEKIAEIRLVDSPVLEIEIEKIVPGNAQTLLIFPVIGGEEIDPPAFLSSFDKSKLSLGTDTRYVTAGDRWALAPRGGSAPYSYSLISGPGKIDSSSGIYLAPDKLVSSGAVAKIGIIAANGATAEAKAVLGMPGSIDASFGSVGTVIIDQSSGVDVRGLVEQSTGGIVAVGLKTSGSEESLYLRRFTAAGAPDLTFGQDGVVIVPAMIGTSTMHPFIGHDDSIFVHYHAPNPASGNSMTFLAKFGADGNLVASFGTNGTVALTVPNSTGHVYAKRGIGLADGSVLVMASANFVTGFPISGNFAPAGVIFKVLGNGELDPTFNGSGLKPFYLGSDYAVPESLFLHPDQTFYVCGRHGGDKIFVAKFLPSGQLSSNFGGNGSGFWSFNQGQQFPVCALGDDGKLMVATRTNTTTSPIGIQRFDLMTGTSDPSFNGGARVLTNLQMQELPHNVGVRGLYAFADRLLMLVTTPYPAQEARIAALSYYTPSGLAKSDVALNGIMNMNLNPGSDTTATFSLLSRDGRLLVLTNGKKITRVFP